MTTSNTFKNFALGATLATAAAFSLALPAFAEYPERPITLIV